MAEGESLTPVWVLLGSMAAFIAGFTLYVLILHPTSDNLLAQLAINWPKLVVLVLFGGAPFLAWLRLVKVRAKRGRLVRAEWCLDSDERAWYRRQSSDRVHRG